MAGKEFNVVIHPGKVYHDHAWNIRLLADRILAIGLDDFEEWGISDESYDSSVDMSEHGDVDLVVIHVKLIPLTEVLMFPMKIGMKKKL